LGEVAKKEQERRKNTPAAGKVSFTTLNDYGGPMKHEATLQ